MHVDLREIPQDAVIEADLCIIGAGIAGIAIARRFLASDKTVVLLESGGIDHEPGPQSLAEGDSIGFDYYPLGDSRLRMFGGTTAIWGGRVALLDEIDFQRRDWVPHSGWPISREQLDLWYDQARAQLDLAKLSLDERLYREIDPNAPNFDPGQIRVAYWQFDRLIGRTGVGQCQDLWQSENVRVLTHATATRIQAELNGRAIASVRIAESGGRRATVKARHYVLAAGGIDNARILLASDDVQPHGLGNAHDLVGRYFMEHPHARGGRVRLKRPWQHLKQLMLKQGFAGNPVAPCFRPGEQLQMRRRILNTSFALGCRQHPTQRMNLPTRFYQAAKHRMAPTKRNRMLWQGLKRSAQWLQRHSDPLRPWLLDRLDRRGIYAVVRAEQAPNPDSRVLLSADRDALGVPKACLDWQLCDLDKRSVRVMMEAFDSELRRLDIGHVELPGWLRDEGRPWQIDSLVSGHPIGGYHHMGTTRMANDASEGVVDPNGRVFGLANLHVAGSSVFPTSGWANPTLTLLALSLRLGERLAELLAADAKPANVSVGQEGQRVA